MFSLNELIKSSWKMEGEPTYNEKSHPLVFTSEMPVKQERAPEPLFTATDYQQTIGPLTMESSSCADFLSNIEISDVHGSLPQGFHGDPFGAHIDNHRHRDAPAMYPMETIKVDISKLDTWSPYQITSKDDSRGHNAASRHVPLQTSLASYKLSSQLVQMANSQEVSQPLFAYSGGCHLQGPQHHQLRLFNAPGNVTVPHYYSCTSGCQCGCHAPPQRACSHVLAEKYQRPCVIMAPVNREKSGASTVTHLPLQIEGHFNKPLKPPGIGQRIDKRMNEGESDSDDSEKEENFFRRNIDNTTATFKLSRKDWERIPIKSFPSGGRLLGGDWTRIFSNKVKQTNPWCSLRYKNNHVISANSRKMHSAPFFRGGGECKCPECNVKVKFIIKEEKGKYVNVIYTGNVCHKIKN